MTLMRAIISNNQRRELEAVAERSSKSTRILESAEPKAGISDPALTP
jgi:hypothetical protein